MRHLVENPGLAFVVGVAFAVATLTGALTRRSRPCGWGLAAAVAWFAYWVWEVSVPQSGDNIRVDLLAIYPALGVVSLLGVATLIAAPEQS